MISAYLVRCGLNIASRFVAFQFLPQMQLKRLFSQKVSGRGNCAKDACPECSPENLKNTPCAEKKRKERENSANQSAESQVIKSIWWNPECCNDPCPNAFPRFDQLYYCASDKAKKNYRVTWIECPEIKIVPKKVCCFERADLEPFERRERDSLHLDTACPMGSDTTLMKCLAESGGKCPKITLPGCRPVRTNTKCWSDRKPADCKKFCAPYPSFSECQKPPFRSGIPRECKCLDSIMMCELYKFIKSQIKKN